MDISKEWSTSDINRYYKNSVFLLNKEPVYVTGIRDKSRVKVALYREPSKDNQSWKEEDKIVPLKDLELFLPLASIYNYKGTVIRLERTARRQWNKGLNFKTFSVTRVIDLPNEPYFNNALTPELITLVNTHKYMSVDKALTNINKGIGASYAISDKLWVSVHPYLNDILIGYKQGIFVGVLKEDKSVYLFRGSESLKEEVTKHFKVGGFI